MTFSGMLNFNVNSTQAALHVLDSEFKRSVVFELRKYKTHVGLNQDKMFTIHRY